MTWFKTFITHLIFLIFKTRSYFTETDGITLCITKLFNLISLKVSLFQAFFLALSIFMGLCRKTNDCRIREKTNTVQDDQY